MRLLPWILALLLGLLPAPLAAQGKPVLTVYTYSSFTSDWGPGPAVKKAFEAECSCQLDYVAVEDGAALLSRLQLEGKHTKADVVLGLDTNLTAEARATGLFAPHGQDLTGLKLPIAWTDDVFVPFDYGYFAVVYDKTRLPKPPTSLQELVNGDPSQKILIQDPRSSTPGLGLLLWMREVYGDRAADAWKRLKPRILTVSKGWSEAYELFTKGEAPMVLSYTTSPAYHRIMEKTDQYEAAIFEEGNYLQVEVAAKLVHASEPALADQFLVFMLGSEFQTAIPIGNWMYPVVPADALPEGFDPPLPADRALALDPETVAAGRKSWIEEWLAAFAE